MSNLLHMRTSLYERGGIMQLSAPWFFRINPLHHVRPIDVLRVLDERGPQTVERLAAYFSMSRRAMEGILERLRAEGLVADPQVKRSAILAPRLRPNALTQDGVARLRQETR